MSVRPRICVLTGDPRLPDLTKRDHRYNEEDLVTHRAMREAFESLPGFRFEFFDDHAELFERFALARPGCSAVDARAGLDLGSPAVAERDQARQALASGEKDDGEKEAPGRHRTRI
jgi:hypothetical protein